jgi:hypothetical protein
VTLTPEPSKQIRGLSQSLLRSMLGQTVRSVSYRVDDRREGSELGQLGSLSSHEVGQAVVLETNTTTVVLEWRIDGYDEFLNISVPDLAASAPVANQVDVTDSPQWHPFVHEPIVSFAVATHESEQNSTLLWALRIDGASGKSVVVSLGRVSDGALEYQPDSLLVIFRPQLAQSLQLPNSQQSAWGSEFAP